MNILYGVHHPLDPRLGTPAASMAVAGELSKLGHTVDFYGYDQAFGRFKRRDSSSLRLAFPWRLTAFLLRYAARFDVLDITTGDAWLWAALSQLRAHGRPTIIARSNGIEHLANRAFMQQVRNGDATVSWRYPLYTDGLRLWEVRQSFRLADGAVVLNDTERRFALDRLGAPPETTRVVPHGLEDDMLRLPPPGARERPADGTARLCFVGAWGTHRGARDVVATVELLHRAGRKVSL
ncbi:MAG TPA: glycosyltransferase, partial [Opitutaceae bacterium]|nr:glycosyltransferase [Opitutaceae bacterium]